MGRYVTQKPGDYEHIRIVEAVLGRKLPIGVRVHHVDYDGTNNAHSNLVVCPNESYHKLLHIRQAAMETCGNPDWRKCTHCQKYDDTANMKKLPSLTESYYHRACDSARRRQYNHDKGLHKKNHNI